ncbi:GerMN domain-containing protein [Halanaerobacter jeridensis]|uniref:Spore germination protein GerM n=1 Tax=Halanaerobacter jeridensis TaxID=706427 RepID=A0A938XSW8_9FIRM|nr:GerMN domain-containing protein [Halanaerobacter jeridensis]MBM7556915.1 spore germination protein GerM [Halanaerobacter jeridensis]
MADKNKYVLYIVISILALILLSTLIYSKFFATIESKVYFANNQASYLIAQTREVKKKRLYFNLIQELIKGPSSDDLVATIPPQAKLLGVEVKNKTALVDFSKELKTSHWGGTAGETMTVYSVVNTLAQFNEIDKVKILIEGEEIETLAGHMELSKPLPFNSKIIKSE